jgi:hypothetical protein
MSPYSWLISSGHIECENKVLSLLKPSFEEITTVALSKSLCRMAVGKYFLIVLSTFASSEGEMVSLLSST